MSQLLPRPTPFNFSCGTTGKRKLAVDGQTLYEGKERHDANGKAVRWRRKNGRVVNIANGAQWTVYIDNGSGTASTALINAVIAKFNGVYPTANGYRDAGVPFYVVAVTPTQFSVIVTGTLVSPSQDATQDAAVNAAVQTYANSLQFGQEIQASQLNAVVGATLDGSASSFTVQLLDSSSNPQQVIAVAAISRAQLTSVQTTLA